MSEEYLNTVEHVRRRLEDIAASRGDAERAHSMEDDMHQAVLRSIAEGVSEDPAGCAKAALESLNISFPRWCA